MNWLDKFTYNLLAILIGCAIAFLCGAICGTISDQREAVDHDCGHYNTTNGNFEWNK